ncbi:MAG: F0F1 ATP synthase subunit epsilon [candidate division NC10 bacterium]|nr:F0F1 ATP synthase subunit epsilon [candidate division NC10 bacterium]MBW8056394.1 F0F1 ATP synthase subunit epsilon [candidate division NC10 bacterium]
MARQDGIPRTLTLEIVTPTRMVVRDEVEEVVAPGSEGYFGVLGGHLPFMSTLKIGELAYRKNGRWRYLAVSWGYVEVRPDTVIVLADVAERAEDIDVARAERARGRAVELLGRREDETVDVARSEGALTKALTRIEVAGKT